MQTVKRMSTTAEPVAPAESRPGNLTVRELAASLSQSAPPQSQSPKEDAPESPSPAAESVPAATPSGETDAPDGLPNDIPSEPESSPADTAEPEAPESPPEPVEPPPADPVSSALAAELKPLVDDLKKAGAKGALEILQKRIPKLVDQRDTERNARLAADEKVRALETEVAELRQQNAATTTATAAATTGQHPDVVAVVQKIANVDHWLTQLRQNPGGLEVPDGRGGKVELDADAVVEAIEKLREQRQELVAEKVAVQNRVNEAFKADYAMAHAAAEKRYPELFKADSPEAKLREQLLKALPGLKQFADYELIVGRYINGYKLEMAHTKTSTAAPRKVAPAREPALVPTEPPGAKAAPVNGRSKEIQEAEAAFRKSGKTSDLARWNAAKVRAQRAT